MAPDLNSSRLSLVEEQEVLETLNSEHFRDMAPAEVLQQRGVTLALAHKRHPERFVKGTPIVKQIESAVWINKPVQNEACIGG